MGKTTDQLHEELAEPTIEAVQQEEDTTYKYSSRQFVTSGNAPEFRNNILSKSEGDVVVEDSVSMTEHGYNDHSQKEDETADSGVSEQSSSDSKEEKESLLSQEETKLVENTNNEAEDTEGQATAKGSTRRKRNYNEVADQKQDGSSDNSSLTSGIGTSASVVSSTKADVTSQDADLSSSSDTTIEGIKCSSADTGPATCPHPTPSFGDARDLSSLSEHVHTPGNASIAPCSASSTSGSGHIRSPTKHQKLQRQRSPESYRSSAVKRLQPPTTPEQEKNEPNGIKRKPKKYRSIISDIFNGRLVSTVQCLTCDRISTTTETFQDLSLPIPNQESIQSIGVGGGALLLQRANSISSLNSSLGSATNNSASSDLPQTSSTASTWQQPQGWLSWAWSWIAGWFYGPTITLNDCLMYFFSADELKGDNMYSCEKCKKLRNGLKFSRVTVLPDTLSIHLKRFRHDFAFSTKISSKVTFPLVDLDMSPWLHKDCLSQETRYDLTGVVCHHGTAGGGHYTAYALNPNNEEWYEFDDATVTRVEPAQVLSAEAYVLFYRKNNAANEAVRESMQALLAQDRQTPDGQSASLVQYYVSRQWFNKFEYFAEPGPMDNSDFLCRHGGVPPHKKAQVYNLVVALPRSVWDLLNEHYGSIHCGPTSACTRLFECTTCRDEEIAMARHKAYELEEFKQLHAEFQNGNGVQGPSSVHCISSPWFKQWEAFVTDRSRDPPPQIDNRGIVMATVGGGAMALKPSSDHFQVSAAIWNMWHSIYGGGPEVILRPNGSSIVLPQKHTQADAGSDHGRYNSLSLASSPPLNSRGIHQNDTRQHHRSVSESSFGSQSQASSL